MLKSLVNAPKTYRELFAALKELSDEQLDMNITVQSRAEDEFYPAELRITGEGDVLDEFHPFISF